MAMESGRIRRMKREILDCRNDEPANISIDMIDDNPCHLKGTFFGPQETPYAGGRYEVDIVVPEDYPFRPFEMKFITKIYHPNISSASGTICLNILNDEWSPALTLRLALISVQSLLSSPETKNPQDAEVAKHYMMSRGSFNETAKYWAQIYAGAPGGKGARM